MRFHFLHVDIHNYTVGIFSQPEQMRSQRCYVIAHRGAAALCPENTLPAFQTARDVGAEMIELDVQQSADGELIVFHDETLKRLCDEDLPVASLTAAELTTKVVGRWCGQPVTIPLLAHVFTILGKSLRYNVELKTDTVHYPGIEARLAAMVGTYGLTDEVLVSSFNHESLRNVSQCNPSLSLGMLLDGQQAHHCGSPQGIIARALEFRCFSVHPEFALLRQWPELGACCHTAGLSLFPWTVDDEADWQFLVEVVGVDGIITNDPGRLANWLRARAQNSH
jgi:glycerophosphoryl diester phosphodiesterase